jgi:MFS family permease
MKWVTHPSATAATTGAIIGTAVVVGQRSITDLPTAAIGLVSFGLLNTMVFTHLPSNVLLLLVPLMPTIELAVVILFARFLLSQLDVPTRQSYTMAIIPPAERAAAAGLFSVSRSAAAAVAPAFAGITLAVPLLGIPFVLAGSLKIAYDLTLFAVFRGVQPPEARAQARSVPVVSNR